VSPAAPTSHRTADGGGFPLLADEVIMDTLPQIGLHHPRIKQLRHVIANTGARRHQLLAAEGLWAHEVLLDLGVPVDVFLWCPEAACSPAATHIASRMTGVARTAYRISERVLARIAERERPDGLVSLVAVPQWTPETVPLGQRSLVLVADAIEIPGNLGTLLRTLDACGADCLVMTNRRTRLSHPKVFRGSRGMNLRIPVLDFDDPGDAIKWLRGNGFGVYLATPGPQARDFHRIAFPARTALVVGNERKGITQPWYGNGFTEVTIPMRGHADSLNVAVSAAILLYAARYG
jgi:tRNA G18 (ribose-2'-O)-methylase SpoU